AAPRGCRTVAPPTPPTTARDPTPARHIWMVPNADGPRDHPALKGLDLPPLGQPMHDRVVVTPTLLLAAQGDIIGEAATPPFGGAGDKKFRAYDKATGAVIAEIQLPAGAAGGMMTYLH